MCGTARDRKNVSAVFLLSASLTPAEEALDRDPGAKEMRYQRLQAVQLFVDDVLAEVELRSHRDAYRATAAIQEIGKEVVADVIRRDAEPEVVGRLPGHAASEAIKDDGVDLPRLGPTSPATTWVSMCLAVQLRLLALTGCAVKPRVQCPQRRTGESR